MSAQQGRVVLSVAQVAAALSISVSSVRRMISRGELRSILLGRRRVIPVSEVARIVAVASGADE